MGVRRRYAASPHAGILRVLKAPLTGICASCWPAGVGGGQTGRCVGRGFDPLALTAEASLNRVVIGDAGCPEVAGMRAGQACSRQAMLALATEHGLTGLAPGSLSDGIAAAAAAAGADRAAAATLTGYGRRLGALIATLRDPRTPASRPARPPVMATCRTG
jgi:hypothetical protein